MTPPHPAPPFLRAVVWLASIALLSGCDRAPEQVTLAVALDARNRRGVKLAIDEVNGRGGIHGVTLAIETTDWTDPGFQNPMATLAWADALSRRDDIMGVIGHSDSPSTLAATGLYNERGLPHLVTIATHPDITQFGPWTYRLCLDDRAQGRLLARYLVEGWGKRRIAVFYVNDDYGRGLAEWFQQAVAERGGTIVTSLFHAETLSTEDEELFEATIASWSRAAGPDAIALLNRPNAARRLVDLIRARDLDVAILGGDNLALMLSWASDRERMDGVRCSAYFAPDRSDPEVAQVVAAFEAMWDIPMDYSAAFAYDAVMLMATAIERGGFNRDGVRGALDEMMSHGEEIHGVTGRYRLGPDRNALRSLSIVELRDGVVRPVAQFGADDPAIGGSPCDTDGSRAGCEEGQTRWPTTNDR